MNKKFLYWPLIIAICFLVSCGKSGKLTPEQSKITGPLGDYYEVVDREYSIIDGKISVEIKRIKEGMPAPWEEGMEVGYSDGYFEPHFTIELKDDDGNTLLKDKTDIVSDREDLKTISSLGVDETVSITFDAKEGATKFKVGSTFTVHSGNSNSEDNRSSLSGSYDLKGKVDKYPITMHLEIDGANVNGNYYYDKQGANAQLSLSGTSDGEMLDLNETDSNGTPTGHFKGHMRDGLFRGQFITNKGKSMSFVVTEGDVDDLSFDDDDSSSYEDNSDSSSSGSEDWDALLDSYESYVDKYISYVKKAANGDMSALSEYPSLMQKAQDYSSKLQNAQGMMSSSQWARYNKITMKMMKAAQEMQ